MGGVELLSREGEIAIARRIEAGRDMMINGLCESPLTFAAIISWHDQLKAGRMLLRDIVDLEATNVAAAGEGVDLAEAAPVENSDDEDGGPGTGNLNIRVKCCCKDVWLKKTVHNNALCWGYEWLSNASVGCTARSSASVR